MTDIGVTLTWAEILIAADVGCMRNVQSLKQGFTPGNNAPDENAWTWNIEGAAGEMAVAKHFGIYWSGALGNVRAADVGISYQVKTNTSRKYDDLIIKTTDPDDFPYILVLSFVPRFIICGWIEAHDAKQDKWWREPVSGRPAFFVPRSEMRPMNELHERMVA